MPDAVCSQVRTMPERFLTPLELSRGPDLLRPGSSTGHLGSGRVAFIYTRYADDQGRRFFAEPATTGHESMITQPNVMQALFGPDLPAVLAEVSYAQDGKTRLDHLEIRGRSRDFNLYGRYGTVRGRPVLMLWSRSEGWEDMALKVVALLNVPGDAILAVGTEEVGTVKDLTEGTASGEDRPRPSSDGG